MKDLAPHIFRQRMIVEGLYGNELVLNEKVIKLFLLRLSRLLEMTVVYGPLVIREAEKIYPQHAGYEAVMIWAESGVNLYTWEDGKFFSLDVYSCKAFSPEVVVNYTQRVFEASEVVYKIL